jgi:diguanylate cyclase (GGDEF)-like protein
MPAQEQFSILLVDNDPMVVRVLNRILHEFAPIRYASSGREALKLAHDSVPDLVLLDVNMPEMSGFEVCEAFKGDPALAQVPIIFISSHENVELQAKALQLGVADFLSKPPQGPVVLARVRTFQRMKMLSDTLSGTLRNAVITDFLTGTITRRQFEKLLGQEWSRSNRSAAPLALLLVNIDGFTIYNAEFGEHRGDACLRSVADALRSVAHRPADTLGRYAGGKFAILLPETDARGASTVAQRAIDAVEALQIWHAASAATDRVTLSVGGGCRVFSSLTKGAAAADSSAHTRNTGTVADDLIAAAEHALTEARTAGGSKSRIIDLADPENARSALALN